MKDYEIINDSEINNEFERTGLIRLSILTSILRVSDNGINTKNFQRLDNQINSFSSTAWGLLSIATNKERTDNECKIYMNLKEQLKKEIELFIKIVEGLYSIREEKNERH